MPKARSVEFVNRREVLAAIERAGNDLTDLPDAQAKVAGLVEGAIRQAAPRRSGTLAASITGRVVGGHAVVVSDLIYAPVIDNGWAAHGIEAAHYTQAGLDAAESRVVRTYQREAQVVCDRAERITS